MDHHSVAYVGFDTSKSKYPPAKPGALGDVPLEAADGSLTRPESGLAT